jgi:hypothetical protein
MTFSERVDEGDRQYVCGARVQHSGSALLLAVRLSHHTRCNQRVLTSIPLREGFQARWDFSRLLRDAMQGYAAISEVSSPHLVARRFSATTED